MLLAVLIVALVAKSHSLMIPIKNEDIPLKELAYRACKGVPFGLTVCHPYYSTKYILCDRPAPRVRTCPKNKAYDYGLRTCLLKSIARRCPRMTCPAPGQFAPNVNGSGPFLNNFGSFGPVILNLTDVPGTKTYFCPVIGHCTGGMLFKVTSLGKAPDNHPAQTFHVSFDEVNENGVLYPTRNIDVVGYGGDRVNVTWDAPFHVLAEFDPKAKNAAPIIPYPPQPLYVCPTWPILNISGPMLYAGLLPGERRLMDVHLGTPGEYNLTVDQSLDGWFVSCPLEPHCRHGQIFKIRIIILGPDAKPETKVVNVDWVLSDFQNYPDLILNVGDTIRFRFPGASMTPFGPDITTMQPHGITLLPPELVTSYIESPYPPPVFGGGGK